ncbi:aminoglycoside phosphotransferase family protein [Actinopolymorpha alba]|uniref:phosphotransferase n=1 Tax=Actinopolymorpha alba TaxID=533267 RepID=UPI00036A271A|nr:aminoglycoside phosphotransferase family protein [Actinopolymorpha alba]
MTDQLNRAQQLLHEISQAHDLQFTLRERCRGGVVGAWLLTDPAGKRAILKCNDGMAHRMARMPRLVDRIRSAGCPTPAWLASGVTADGAAYHIVDFVRGEPMSRSTFTGRMAAQLVEVIESQVGLDPDPVQDWSRYARACAFEEGESDPRPVLRRIGSAGVELVEHFDAVLAPYTALDLPGGDLVHGDFNTCNVLTHHDGGVSAVIDVDACGSGTRAVDYARLLREAYVRGGEPEAIAAIRLAGEAVAGPGVLAICAAATAFDITHFMYRYDPRSLPWVIAGLHRLADGLQRG